MRRRNLDRPTPLKGHFHPKGKAPSKYTLEVLKQARTGLPFGDQRDFDEQKRGLIAPMKDLKIMANAGHVAWDMERFQFLDKQDDFDSIHPSLLRQSKLNNNYGLYEVIPGIYQVRGFDLSDITFVRGKTGWIVFDPSGVEGACRSRRGSCFSSMSAKACPFRLLSIRTHMRITGEACAASSMKRMYGPERFAVIAPSTSWTSRFPRMSTPATR